jgi:hypothetical protein
MLLVAVRLPPACLVVLFSASACHDAPSKAGATAAPPSSTNSVRAERAVPSSSPTSGAAPGASALAIASSAPSAAREYPAIAKPLQGDCESPHALLAIRKEYDRSARIWLQQALLAHPEYQLVREAPTTAAQVQIYETIYGLKNFSRSYAGQPRFSEALIARCADVATCNRLAAMFQAVSARDAASVSCGPPPGITGGFSLVKELSPERLQLSSAAASPESACARVHACAAHEGTVEGSKVDCTKLPKAELGACVRATSCSEVMGCITKVTG